MTIGQKLFFKKLLKLGQISATNPCVHMVYEHPQSVTDVKVKVFRVFEIILVVQIEALLVKIAQLAIGGQ